MGHGEDQPAVSRSDTVTLFEGFAAEEPHSSSCHEIGRGPVRIIAVEDRFKTIVCGARSSIDVVILVVGGCFRYEKGWHLTAEVEEAAADVEIKCSGPPRSADSGEGNELGKGLQVLRRYLLDYLCRKLRVILLHCFFL
ncbi:hypothetical protein LINGRAHAP2_LOCUS9102 [Linum grandiflorum]